MDRHTGVNNVKMYVHDLFALLRCGRDIRLSFSLIRDHLTHVIQDCITVTLVIIRHVFIASAMTLKYIGKSDWYLTQRKNCRCAHVSCDVRYIFPKISFDVMVRQQRLKLMSQRNHTLPTYFSAKNSVNLNIEFTSAQSFVCILHITIQVFCMSVFGTV